MSFRSKITIKKWHNFFSIFSFCVKTRQRGRNYAKYRIIFYGISSSSCWICLWFMLRFYCEAGHFWWTNQGAIVRWRALQGGRCFRFKFTEKRMAEWYTHSKTIDRLRRRKNKFKISPFFQRKIAKIYLTLFCYFSVQLPNTDNGIANPNSIALQQIPKSEEATS